MTTVTDDELEELAEAMVVANTPASLVEWLQRNVTVRRLADESEDSLLDDLHRVVRERRRSERSLAWAYGLLTAIGMKRRAASGNLGSLPVDPALLHWGLPMWDKLVRSAVPTGIIILRADREERPSITSVHQDAGAAVVILDQRGRPIVNDGGMTT